MDEKEIKEAQDRICELLSSTQREGMGDMINYLVDEGFFTAPASSRFHGSYYGGLAKHSLAVYDLLIDYALRLRLDKKASYGQMPITIKPVNIIIACLLHDICKLGAYKRTKKDDGWTNNRDKEKGHAKLSISRIKHYIKLEKLEEMMIHFHMGLYGCIEFQDSPDDINGEYHLRGETTPEQKKAMSAEQKKADQKKRYGKSLSNATFHNPICKVLSICDEIATLEEKATDD